MLIKFQQTFQNFIYSKEI